MTASEQYFLIMLFKVVLTFYSVLYERPIFMNIQINAKLKENTFCIHVVLLLINAAHCGYIYNPKCDSTTRYGAVLWMKCDHLNESY